MKRSGGVGVSLKLPSGSRPVHTRTAGRPRTPGLVRAAGGRRSGLRILCLQRRQLHYRSGPGSGRRVDPLTGPPPGTHVDRILGSSRPRRLAAPIASAAVHPADGVYIRNHGDCEPSPTQSRLPRRRISVQISRALAASTSYPCRRRCAPKSDRTAEDCTRPDGRIGEF